jgi:hypothetical protein
MGHWANVNGCRSHFSKITDCIKASTSANWSIVTHDLIAACVHAVQKEVFAPPIPASAWQMFEPEMVAAFECYVSAPAVMWVDNDAGWEVEDAERSQDEDAGVTGCLAQCGAASQM